MRPKYTRAARWLVLLVGALVLGRASVSMQGPWTTPPGSNGKIRVGSSAADALCVGGTLVAPTFNQCTGGIFAGPYAGVTWGANLTVTDTGTKNDYAPSTGLVGNTVVFLNNATLLTINGLSSTNISNGTLVRFVSIGAGQVDLPHQNTGSAAANRFLNFATSGSTSLAAGSGIADYQFDATTTRWRLVHHEQGAWITPTFAAGNYTANGAMTWTVQSGDVQQQKYRLTGRTVTINFLLATTTVGGTANTTMTINNGAWGSFTAVSNAAQSLSLRFSDNSAITTATPGLIAVAGTIVNLFKDGVSTTNWTLSTDLTTLLGTISFEVQ